MTRNTWTMLCAFYVFIALAPAPHPTPWQDAAFFGAAVFFALMALQPLKPDRS